MSESMSSPWIRDYLVDVAETYGAQLYNAPAMTKGRKKVQLIDFLTYHENSYVWAWISDKNFRVSARISKDAVDEYKSKHGRSIIDCRHDLVFVSSFRPMFSPRPLGSKSPGNTPISHMSLEIGSVAFMGIGAHMFGIPRDLESDQKMKEWILGLRQDGGGGNVLRIRKQQTLEQNRKEPSPPPPPFSSHVPVSQHETTAIPEGSAKPTGERPQSFQRLYAKRWQKVDRDPWKFAAKPEEREQLGQPKPSSLAKSHLENTNGLGTCVTELSISPPRTPLRTPSRQQGTPTDWSPSNKGSPTTTNVTAPPNGIGRHDEPDILTTSQTPFDVEHIEDTATTLDSSSLQPPTPAQRIKPLIFSSSPRTGDSPEKLPSSPGHVQHLPSSPPLPLTSPLPLLPSSLPDQMGIRRTIQRKVPHPGIPPPQPGRAKQGPVQILVPNSDTSGTTFSQSSSQSQRLSQSQQHQPQPLSHLPSLPSSLTQEFKPVDSSTPREGEPSNPKTGDVLIISQHSSIRGDIDNQENPAGEEHGSGRANANSRELEGSGSTRPPTQSAPRIEVLEVGTSDTEEETEALDLARSSTGTGKGLANKSDHSLEDSTPYNTDKNNLHPAAASVMINPPTSAHGVDNIPTQASSRTSQQHESHSAMHSLFSDSLSDEPTPSSRVPVLPIGGTGNTERGTPSSSHVPRHDPEAWREPSFMAKNKGKARAVEELNTPNTNISRKRRLSAQTETPVAKRAKVASRKTETRPTVLDQTAGVLGQEDSGSSDLRKTPVENPPTKTAKTTTPPGAIHSPKPRLSAFVVSFDKVNLSGGGLMPKLSPEDYNGPLLRTGWIRTQGDKVEKDGSAYIEEV